MNTTTSNPLTHVESRGQIEIITLNRPEALNAMSPELADELSAYFTSLQKRRDVRVVLLRAEGRLDPARARRRTLRMPFHSAAFLLFRTAILLPNVFLPYSFAAPSWRPGFKPLKALASYASALGYVWGWYRGG